MKRRQLFIALLAVPAGLAVATLVATSDLESSPVAAAILTLVVA